VYPKKPLFEGDQVMTQIRSSLQGKPRYYELAGRSDQRASEKERNTEEEDHKAIRIEIDEGISKEEVVDGLFRNVSLTTPDGSAPACRHVILLANPRSGSQNALKFVK
jgi:hypothetical protein